MTSPGYLSHLLGTVVEAEPWACVSVLQQYLGSCLGAAANASYQHDTLRRIPGAVIPSVLVDTVGNLPGAGAGEVVAGCGGRRVVPATRGQPCLCMEISTVGKVWKGADPASIGVEKLHRSVTGGSARYEDH